MGCGTVTLSWDVAQWHCHGMWHRDTVMGCGTETLSWDVTQRHCHGMWHRDTVMGCGTETNHQLGPKVLLQMPKYKTMPINLKGVGGKAYSANSVWLTDTDRTVISTYRCWKGEWSKFLHWGCDLKKRTLVPFAQQCLSSFCNYSAILPGKLQDGECQLTVSIP